MKIVKYLWFVCVMLITYSTSSYSAVALNIENGILKGATGVIVSGSSYDVSFQEGSCFDLFNGCDESSDFFFPIPDTQGTTFQNSKAFLASQALLDQVFLDSVLGLFDTDPTLTFGCDNGNVCAVLTPVFPVSSPIIAVHAIFSGNSALESVDLPGVVFGRPVAADSSIANPGGDTDVFAIWSNNVSSVPVPATIWLFCSGLLGLFGMSKYHRVPTLSA